MAIASAQSIRSCQAVRLQRAPRSVLPGVGSRLAHPLHCCYTAPPTAAISASNGASSSSAAVLPQPSSLQPFVVNIPEPKPAVLPPALNFQNVVAMGKAKISLPSGKVFLIGVMAGIFIAFGGFLMAAVGGNTPGLATSNPGLHKLLAALTFPIGLLMVVLNAPELYTGNTAITTASALEGEMPLPELLRNWFCSFTGNLVGSLLMVAAVAACGSLAGNMMPVNLALAKTSLGFGTAFLRAILANWLVCVAVFQASAASSLPGKLMGLWLPITVFATLGLEHSVANMFTIPMGIALGANVSVADFLLKNLLPVTLGNTVAGVCMATVMSACYGALGKKLFPAKQ